MRISRALQPGMLVCDTNMKMTRDSAQALRAYGASLGKEVALWRYVFYGPPRPGDIDKNELDACLAERIIMLLVQHPPDHPWQATGALGTQNVAAAIAQAQRAGYVTPDGQPPIAISSDNEDISNIGNAPLAYLTSWRDGCRASNFGAVGYLGFASGFVARQTVSLDGVEWWCDGADVSMRPGVQYSLKQELPFNRQIAGGRYDVSEALIGDRIYGLYDDGSDPVIPEAVDPS